MTLIWRGDNVMPQLNADVRSALEQVGQTVESYVKGSMRKGGRTESGEVELVKYVTRGGKTRSKVMGIMLETGERETIHLTGTYSSAPGEVPRVQKGRLKGSIHHELDPVLPIMRVGTNVKYGCIGSQTEVVTNRGAVRICDLMVGDHVLSQDGGFHPVDFIRTFPSSEKPDLVKLEVEWRRGGRTHHLTMTQDHKVLTERNGALCWVPAGDLLVSDSLFCRKKPASGPYLDRVGTTKVEVNCAWCDKPFKYVKTHLRNTKAQLCSRECLRKWRIKMHTGMKRGEKTRGLISSRTIERLTIHPETHPCRIMAKKGFRSVPEKEVERWLQTAGWKYEPQFSVGRSFVDFAVPTKKLLIEADGAYWHTDQSKDIARDKKLLAKLPGWNILHLHFTDARWTKAIDPNPIPGVQYIQCNSSMNSFIDDRMFERKRVLSVSKFKFDNKGFSGGNKPYTLYDIGIRDVHSFIANGVVVSNSWLEFGTRFLQPRPFMRPAMMALLNWTRTRFSNVLKGKGYST